ncbi:MAG: hypothetical protein ACR2JO_14785 [Mycobacteriales bacterium]
MADILAFGRAERVRRRRKPPTGLLVLVAIAVLVGIGLWHGRAPGPVAGAGVATPSPRPAEGAGGAPARYRLEGRRTAGPVGLRLLVGGGDPVVVDAHTGRVAPWRRLRPLAAGNTVALQRLPAATVALVNDAQYQPVAAYVLPDVGGTVSVGRVEGVLPAVGGGLFGYNSGSTSPPGRLVRLDADGRVLWRRSFSLPTFVQADTPHGLLVWSIPGAPVPGGPLRLVDARTGKIRRELGRAGFILASTPDAVAWVPDRCGDQCQLTVTDLASGRSTRYTTPDGRLPGYAAFSPNQRLLAVSFFGLHEQTPELNRDGFAAVLDLVSGRLRTIPGLTTEAKSAASLAWSPTGAWLAMGVRSPGGNYSDRLVLWRSGETGLTVLPPVLPPESSASGLVILP